MNALAPDAGQEDHRRLRDAMPRDMIRPIQIANAVMLTTKPIHSTLSGERVSMTLSVPEGTLVATRPLALSDLTGNSRPSALAVQPGK